VVLELEYRDQVKNQFNSTTSQGGIGVNEEVFFYGHKTKSIVFGHTHKKTIIKIFNHYFINFLFIIKIMFLYVCVTKYYLFGLVTILEFLVNESIHWHHITMYAVWLVTLKPLVLLLYSMFDSIIIVHSLAQFSYPLEDPFSKSYKYLCTCTPPYFN
jgi:hypothetical protein